jgi:hypothetical protein|nr:MAG TPA: excisionase [Caudoviricetes sp.]
MEAMIPVEFDAEKISKQISVQVLQAIEKRMELVNKTYDLPPYPTQQQLKKALEIGQDRLNDWIARGLKKQIWSTGSTRYDREEVRKFLKENFEI